MSEKYFEITKKFVVKFFCDKCEAKGESVEMEYRIVPYPILMQRYEHVCPKCNHMSMQPKRYPVFYSDLIEITNPFETQNQEDESLKKGVSWH